MNNNSNKKQTEPIWVDINEVSRLLGVSPKWIRKMAGHPGFPQPIILGCKMHRYVLKEVLRWAQKTQDDKHI